MEKRRQTYNRLIYVLKSTFSKVVIYFCGEVFPLGKKLEIFVFLVWIWPKNAKKLENLPTFLTTKLKKRNHRFKGFALHLIQLSYALSFCLFY
jgi:hypothetical protein